MQVPGLIPGTDLQPADVLTSALGNAYTAAKSESGWAITETILALVRVIESSMGPTTPWILVLDVAPTSISEDARSTLRLAHPFLARVSCGGQRHVHLPTTQHRVHDRSALFLNDTSLADVPAEDRPGASQCGWLQFRGPSPKAGGLQPRSSWHWCASSNRRWSRRRRRRHGSWSWMLLLQASPRTHVHHFVLHTLSWPLFYAEANTTFICQPLNIACMTAHRSSSMTNRSPMFKQKNDRPSASQFAWLQFRGLPVAKTESGWATTETILALVRVIESSMGPTTPWILVLDVAPTSISEDARSSLRLAHPFLAPVLMRRPTPRPSANHSTSRA